MSLVFATEGLTERFADRDVVDDVDLHVPRGCSATGSELRREHGADPDAAGPHRRDDLVRADEAAEQAHPHGDITFRLPPEAAGTARP
jgi:hypothetical protein